MVQKIVIDPGHGGNDAGAVGFGLQEKNINLDIALKLADKLRNYAEISLTRSTDIYISLPDRAGMANKTGANLFLSIHVNAGGGTGFESYIYSKATSENQHLREIIHKEVAAFYAQNGFPDRGMKTADFEVLRLAAMPALLLENLFIDTKTDADKLKDPAFRQAVAGAIAGGVIKALSLQAQPGQPVSQPAHWADGDFIRLYNTGLVNSQHDLNSDVTWGEMSAVVARLLDKLKM